MTSFRYSRSRPLLAPLALLVALVAVSAAFGLVVPQDPHRFDALTIADPAVAASPVIRSLAAFEADSGLTGATTTIVSRWRTFRAEAPAERWSVWLDARSGAPALVQGEGIPWIPGDGNQLSVVAEPTTLDSLADSLKTFVHDNAALLVADENELVLNREGSGELTPDLWQVVFDRTVGGVPVTGDGFIFSIGHGNLISFGSPRWSLVTASPVPTLDAGAAFTRLRTYLGLGKAEPVAMYENGTLAFTPMLASGSPGDEYTSALGAGYRTALTWKFVFGLGDDAASWVGLVDAHTGAVLALYDDTKYAQLKGGVFPFSNDGIAPDGVEQANYPMPFANMTVNGGAAQSNGTGNFACTGGNASVSNLSGPYVLVSDTCGVLSQSIACDNDLDFGTSSGTDCTVPAGKSAGDTHSARSSFYHLNRIKEHARAWLPANVWLTQQLQDNVNINLTCNAFWSPIAGTVNFYRSGGGCRNTGEIAGVFLHEWGHGLSQNDGAGSANPDEAYADVTSVLLTHNSCIGRGFTNSNCSGYGNACTACTGVRDMDYAKHATGLPQTPASWPASCPTGSGPCGREPHCEAYLPGEVLWDLAVRDLPASGLDQNTAWALLDRMWYKSRQGTSGNAYACSGGTGNSCAATHWMQQLRTLDDDDGNLANGTPHAAAIWAAFNRHAITCGLATDAANLSTTSCPPLGAPVLTGSAGSNTASLSWPAVTNASSYHVLRNDQSCNYGHSLVANQPGTTYNDTGLANGFPEYYAVQAQGTNSACLGPLSNCVSVTPTALSADLSVTVSDAPDPAAVQTNVTYTITVANAGPGGATSLTLTENTTTSATFVSLTQAGWTCSTPAVGTSGAISCTMPNLANGANSILTLVVKLKSCLGNGTIVTNNASIAATSSDSVPGNNSGSTGTTVTDPGTCDDGNACTLTDSCVAGSCVGSNPVVCTASDQCHQVGTCNPATGVCSNPQKPNGSSCDDSNACTQLDSCQSGTCVGSNPIVCTASDQCHQVGTCNPATGVCSNPQKPNGSSCDDNNACTTGDTCQSGSCASGTPVTCTALDQCHAAGTCDTLTGQCSNPAAPNGIPCEDGNVCSIGDSCQNGTCASGAPAPPPGEVNDSVMVSGSTIAWSDGAGVFNVYRGTQAVGTPWAYNQACLGSSTAGPASDPSAPAADGLFYYLVSRRDACGESVIGRDSLGAVIPNTSPCP